jgi:hypothetical protein
VQKQKIDISQLKFQREIAEKFCQNNVTQVTWEVAKQNNKHANFQTCAIKIRTNSSCSLQNFLLMWGTAISTLVYPSVFLSYARIRNFKKKPSVSQPTQRRMAVQQ